MSSPVPQTAIVDNMPAGTRTLPAQMRPSLIARMAEKFHVDADKMMTTLKQTAFRQEADQPEPTNEEMMALLIVADQYGLNPWTRELYAFRDKRRGGIVPIVGMDGWSRIVNNHEHYDGVEFTYGPASANAKYKSCPEWIECSVWRKDRTHPTVVREILAECYRETGPWNSHPSRMLRHKAFMQGGRLAFSFVGIYDEDEARAIIEGESSRVAEAQPPAIARINATVRKAEPAAIEHNPGDSVPADFDAHATTVSLSDEQAAELLREVQPNRPGAAAFIADAAEAPTFALMAGAINEAATLDDLNLAVDLIRSVTSKQQQRELNLLAADKRAALTTEGKPQ